MSAGSVAGNNAASGLLYIFIAVDRCPGMHLLHHFVYGNADQVGNGREQKDVGIAKLPFPFGYSLRADPEELSEFALRKPVLPAVIQDTFADSDSVLHFTRLYVS